MMRDGEHRVEDDRLRVQSFVLNDLLTNGFVVQARDTGSIVIIDPGDRGRDLVEAAEAWGGDVRWILVTHHHGDHWGALQTVRDAVHAPVAAPPGASFRVDRSVVGGERLQFAAQRIQVYRTPGHSPESVSFQIGDHVFVGDFVFRLGSGRTDGADASTEALVRTVREVFAPMPDETTLWCGHGPPSTVGEERDGNPFWKIAIDGDPPEPVDEVRYRGEKVPVLAWADDYDKIPVEQAILPVIGVVDLLTRKMHRATT